MSDSKGVALFVLACLMIIAAFGLGLLWFNVARLDAACADAGGTMVNKTLTGGDCIVPFQRLETSYLPELGPGVYVPEGRREVRPALIAPTITPMPDGIGTYENGDSANNGLAPNKSDYLEQSPGSPVEPTRLFEPYP